MKALSDPLWQKLAAFTFDTPAARLSFTARLARDNAWSLAFARRVLEEYRRFLYLAVRAGHPVTPSDAVDQAWHLHLVYTESYWNELCAETLGRPLHHGPTKGGTAEDAKFEDWYERTRASYRAHFGENLPLDIWPPSSVRFGPASRGRRVSPHDAWIIPKPKLLRRHAATAFLAIGIVPLFLAEAVGDGHIAVIIAALVLGLFIVGGVMWNSHSDGKRGRGGCGTDAPGGCSSGGKGGHGHGDHDGHGGGDSGCGSGGCGGGGGD